MKSLERVHGTTGIKIIIGSAFFWAWLDALFMSMFFVRPEAEGFMAEMATIAVFGLSLPWLALSLAKPAACNGLLAKSACRSRSPRWARRGSLAAPACRHQPQLDRARRRRNLRRRVHGSLPAGMGRCVLPRRRAERDALRGRRLRLRHRRRRAASVHDTRGRRRVLGAAAPRLGRVVREHRPPVAHVPPHRPRRPAAEAERPLAPESAPRNLDDAVVRRGPRHDRVRLPAAPRFVLAYRQRRLSQRHPRASRARRHGGARVRHRRAGTAPGKRGVPRGAPGHDRRLHADGVSVRHEPVLGVGRHHHQRLHDPRPAHLGRLLANRLRAVARPAENHRAHAAAGRAVLPGGRRRGHHAGRQRRDDARQRGGRDHRLATSWSSPPCCCSAARTCGC